MMKQLTYRHTFYALCTGCSIQAVVNNLTPLLFVTFQRTYALPLSQIGLLISLNFGTQIVVDLVCAKLLDKIGYRAAEVLSHAFCAVGLILLGVLPQLLPPFAGILIAVLLMAIGSGITEVLQSALTSSLPGDAKAADMSRVHSFYSWGQVAVVLLSTAYFWTAGTQNWRWLPLLWAVLPLINLLAFLRVPLPKPLPQTERSSLRGLWKSSLFWAFFALMLCGGAAELGMSQWASLFAEEALGLPKAAGDLLGPCAFAVMMGLGRLYFSKKGSGLKVQQGLLLSGLLCVISYWLTVFSPWPLLSMVGCGLCGLSVALMWPGAISLAGQRFPAAGTALFAFLSLAGDVGCSAGPGLVGWVSDAVQSSGGTWLHRLWPSAAAVEFGMKAGLLAASVFPAIFVILLLILRHRKSKASA